MRLSKTRFLAGLQCHTRLYLDIHARNLVSEFDAGTQAVHDAGTRVGGSHGDGIRAALDTAE